VTTTCIGLPLAESSLYRFVNQSWPFQAILPDGAGAVQKCIREWETRNGNRHTTRPVW